MYWICKYNHVSIDTKDSNLIIIPQHYVEENRLCDWTSQHWFCCKIKSVSHVKKKTHNGPILWRLMKHSHPMPLVGTFFTIGNIFIGGFKICIRSRVVMISGMTRFNFTVSWLVCFHIWSFFWSFLFEWLWFF